MNTKEKQLNSGLLEPDVGYPVMEHFETLQGEGFWTGTPSYFIRLGGCDVGCVWCDVKESWDFESHPTMSTSSLISSINKSNLQHVVITGGEPTLYDLTHLTHTIFENGGLCHIETAGVYPLTGSWHWICFSPKKFKKPLDTYYENANELKVVIYHPSDLEWAESHAQKMNKRSELYLQPEWSRVKTVLPNIIEYVKLHPHWKISLQSHKYMGIP